MFLANLSQDYILKSAITKIINTYLDSVVLAVIRCNHKNVHSGVMDYI